MKRRFLFFWTLLILALIFGIIIFENPIVGKFLTGSARIIGNETKSEVYINGVIEKDAKIYEVKSNFSGIENRDYLILYLRNLKNKTDFQVLIIDKENQTIGYPNSSLKDYDIIFGKLYQSDSGANVIVPINDKTKGIGFEPNLKIEKKIISFKIPDKNKINTIKINVV